MSHQEAFTYFVFTVTLLTVITLINFYKLWTIPIIAKVLSWLLHHANRLNQSNPFDPMAKQRFYTIKNQILKRYGTNQGYDVQFIEGKKCYSCSGTGIYTYYDWHDNHKCFEPCYNCYDGWFKRPTWNILARVKFGRYIFHQPYERVYKAPTISNPIIEGYIDHTKSRFSLIASSVLFLIYEKGYLKRWYKYAGHGWYCSWWLPENIPSNMVHLIKHGWKSFPINKAKRKLKNRYQELKNKLKYSVPKINTAFVEDELPF